MKKEKIKQIIIRAGKLILYSSPGTLVDFTAQLAMKKWFISCGALMLRLVPYYLGVIVAFFCIKSKVYNSKDNPVIRFSVDMIAHLLSFMLQYKYFGIKLYAGNDTILVWCCMIILNAIVTFIICEVVFSKKLGLIWNKHFKKISQIINSHFGLNLACLFSNVLGDFFLNENLSH